MQFQIHKQPETRVNPYLNKIISIMWRFCENSIGVTVYADLKC